MNLNNLKPAWKTFRLINSLERLDPQEILTLIEQENDKKNKKLIRFFVNTAVIIFLMVFCKGG